MAQSVKELLKNWTRKTYDLFQAKQREWNVGDTMSLYHTMKHKTSGSNDETVTAQFRFLEYGRFVDMGVGNGVNFAEARSLNRGKFSKGRKPKKWYSRTFFGRLNALQAAIGFTFTERSINAVKEPLTLQSYTTRRGRAF